MIPIFIVRFRNTEVEDRCIQEATRYTGPDLEDLRLQNQFSLVVWDNGHADENLSTVWNRMVRQAKQDTEFIHVPDPAFLLLNTDAFLVDRESLQVMRKALYSSKTVAAVGPMTDNAGSVQALSHKFWTRVHKDELGKPGGAHSGQVLIDHHISGFALMIRLAAWEDVGGFPEDSPLYGQESAFIEAAWSKGWHTLVCMDAFVEHIGGSSIKAAEARGEMNQDEERRKGAAWFRDFRRQLTG